MPSFPFNRLTPGLALAGFAGLNAAGAPGAQYTHGF